MPADIEMLEVSGPPQCRDPEGRYGSKRRQDSEVDNNSSDKGECSNEEGKQIEREHGGFRDFRARDTAIPRGKSTLNINEISRTAAVVIEVYGQARQLPEALESFLAVWTSEQNPIIVQLIDNKHFQEALTQVKRWLSFLLHPLDQH